MEETLEFTVDPDETTETPDLDDTKDSDHLFDQDEIVKIIIAAAIVWTTKETLTLVKNKTAPWVAKKWEDRKSRKAAETTEKPDPGKLTNVS